MSVSRVQQSDAYMPCVCSVVSDSATPWTAAHQAPLSVGFPRQEYCSGLSFTPPGDLPDPGIESVSLTSPALASRFFTTSATENYPEEAVSCSYVLNPYGWERESLAQS